MNEIAMWVLIGIGVAFIPILLWLLISVYSLMLEDAAEMWERWKEWLF